MDKQTPVSSLTGVFDSLQQRRFFHLDISIRECAPCVRKAAEALIDLFGAMRAIVQANIVVIGVIGEEHVADGIRDPVLNRRNV